MLHRIAVTLSVMGMFVGQLARAAGPVDTNVGRGIIDISLQQGDLLHGQLLDAQGIPEANSPVVLTQEGRPIADARTDADGTFRVAGVRAGVYELATVHGRGVYRLWAPDTAPPSAQQGVLMYSGEVVRGKGGSGHGPWMHGLGSTLANPWVLALIVAAAIAIPLALDDDDDAS